MKQALICKDHFSSPSHVNQNPLVFLIHDSGVFRVIVAAYYAYLATSEQPVNDGVKIKPNVNFLDM